MSRTVTVSLVVRLDDITTGRPVWPADASLRVCGAPVAKNDGYFVFTGTRPEVLRVTSAVYHGLSLPIPDTDYLRIAMTMKTPPNGRWYMLDAGDGAYVGFYGARDGYALAAPLEEGRCELTVHKEDYADLAGLRHILIAPDGTETPVYLSAGTGYGRYTLSEPAPRPFPLRTRLLPLYHVYGSGLRIPVPENARIAYVLRGGAIEKKEVQIWASACAAAR